jgi:hypothetical protein
MIIIYHIDLTSPISENEGQQNIDVITSSNQADLMVWTGIM